MRDQYKVLAEKYSEIDEASKAHLFKKEFTDVYLPRLINARDFKEFVEIATEVGRVPAFKGRNMRESIRNKIGAVDKSLMEAFNLVELLLFFNKAGPIDINEPIFMGPAKFHFNEYSAKRALTQQNKDTGINLDI